MYLSAPWVVDRNLDIHRDGKVFVSGLKESIDLENCILLPGLVNAHVHLDYTDMRGKVSCSGSFYQWITELVRLKRMWTEKEYENSIRKGFQQSLSFGTTAMGNWVCLPDLVPSFKENPGRVVWFLEQISIREKTSVTQWSDWVGKIEKDHVHWRSDLAPHAPYTSEWNAVEEMLQWTKSESRRWSMHLAESREETEMFKSKTGDMFKGFFDLGRCMDDCGKGTPVQLMKSLLNNFGGSSQLIHMNDLNQVDLELLAGLPFKPSVVHCPRSHHFFNHPPFLYHSLRKIGVRVALGTDSLASNEDLSMFAEMGAFQKVFTDVSPREILSMATVDSAASLGWEQDWKKWNDWIAIPVQVSQEKEVMEAIVNFTGSCCFVMIDGLVVKHLS